MFEEVKEMIDSTIYTNGRGEVTAQNINLAMHGMVDATEEKFGEVNDAVKAVEDKVTALEENGTGGGSGALRVWVNEGDAILDDDKISENVATYNSIAEGTSGSVVFMAEFMEDDGSVFIVSYAVTVYETFPGGVSLAHGSIIYTGDGVENLLINAVLYPDGTTEITIA